MMMMIRMRRDLWPL